MTARIHCSGIANRRDASITNDAYGPTGRGFDGSEANAAVASSALALDGSSDADKEARKHAAIRISRRLAIVPAAVRGDALLGRTSGQSPPPRHKIGRASKATSGSGQSGRNQSGFSVA